MSDHAGSIARRAAALRIFGTTAVLLGGTLAAAAIVRPEMLMGMVHAVMGMLG